MVKRLNKTQILELSQALRDIFIFMKVLEQKIPIAKKLYRPRIPSILSESIVAHLIESKLILGELSCLTVELGKNNKEPDVKILTKKRIEKSVEVKATGERAWQRLGKKDINANYLVWVHFGQFFQSENNTVHIYVIENPKLYLKQTNSIILKDMKKLVGPDLISKKIDFDNFLRVKPLN